MSTLLTFPARGPWGRSDWPGNCSGFVYQHLFNLLRPKTFVDPMVGSGTSVEVATEMGIKAFGLDLHSGFNVLRQSILATVGEPVDFVFSHPPYHQLVRYSGNVWGDAHPDDLSRCATPDEFLEKLQFALFNQRDATRGGGVFGCLIGDFWHEGRFISAQAELVSRMPSDELRGVMIKAQHNVRSEKKSYSRLRFPRLSHEYILLWEKPRRVISLLQTLANLTQRDRTRTVSTWRAIVYTALVGLGGRTSLETLYESIARSAPERLATNPNWKAKVRQTLQVCRDLFTSSERGTWCIAGAR